jgi:hypothetical protein
MCSKPYVMSRMALHFCFLVFIASYINVNIHCEAIRAEFRLRGTTKLQLAAFWTRRDFKEIQYGHFLKPLESASH